MCKGIIRYMAFVCALLILFSIGGVFAIWVYVRDHVEEAGGDLSVALNEFAWKPVDILPTESELGKNHLALIELILNENNKGYGLNYDKKHVLEQYLNSEGIVFSNQKTTSGNLKFVSDETKQLYYCIVKISETEYYAYTFAKADVASAMGSNTKIPVYRTILQKTNRWEAPKSYFGYAKTASLRSFGASNVSGELAYSIGPDSFSALP